MKKNILPIVIVLLAFIFNACSSDEPKDPTENPETNECLDLVDLDSYYDKIIYLDFIDDNNGWVIGYNTDNLNKRILLNTADSGTTWNLIDDDFKMLFDGNGAHSEALQFVNTTNGVKHVEFETDSKLTIEYTTDKGTTWQTYNNPFFTYNPVTNDTEYTTPHWVRTSASNGTETLFLGELDSDLFVLKINNTTMNISYSHWDVGGVISLDYDSNGALHYAANGTIVAVIDADDASIKRSTDNGTTWTTVQELGSTGFHSATWPNDNIGFLVFGSDWAGGEKMYKTTNGGITWESFVMSEQGSGYDRKLTMISFVNENDGIGVSAFDFFVTNDGGRVWVNQMCYTTDGQYNAGFDEVISYPSLNNGWIAGSSYNSYTSPSTQGVFHYQGE